MEVLTVTQANLLAKELLESVPIWVEGEAFDVRQKDQRYRYHYFYLKDPETEYQLPCIAEPYYVDSLPFSMEEGAKYRMFGNLTLWEKGGKYQFSVKKIVTVGEGNLLRDLEELKLRLQKDGLFDESVKKPIPLYPERIGVITSLASGSAAWDDFRRHSVDAYPFIEVVVRDCYVQGDKAVQDVVHAIAELDTMNLDLIVVTRGGGALEDLMAFNSEEIARAIFAAKTPIISAIGHEKDFTIADLVADARASTPTNAAHLVTQHYQTLFETIDALSFELQRTVTQGVENYYQQLDFAFEKLGRVQDRISTHKKYLQSLQQQLVILSPANTLERGYSIVQDAEGKLIRESSSVAIGQEITVRLARGKLGSTVIKIESD